MENLTGTLNLGVTSLVAGYVLSDLLARYRRAFPGVTVSAIGTMVIISNT